jgi:hypothetical protein
VVTTAAGEVTLNRSWALVVDRKDPLDETEALIFSSDVAMTKELFSLKWQKARDVSRTGLNCARTLKDEVQRLERIDKENAEELSQKQQSLSMVKLLLDNRTDHFHKNRDGTKVQESCWRIVIIFQTTP